MVVKISYLEVGGADAKEMVVPPQDYFDPGEGDVLTVTSLPKHDRAHVYTGVPAARLKWTILHVADGREFWRVRTQFLDGDRCLMIHSSGSDGAEEIINQTEIEPGVWHVVRTLKEPSRSWATVANSADFVGRGVPDRFPAQYTGNQTFDELKAFCEER